MLTDSFGQEIEYLDYTDAPDLSAWGAALANDIAPQTVMRFASANARAATLTGAQAPVVGMVTYCVVEDRLDVYQAGGWTPITPGAWTTLTFASGFAAATGTPAYRIVNGTVELRGTLQKGDGSPFTTASIFTVATLPSAIRPPAYRYFAAATSWAANMYGRIEVHPDGTLAVGIPAGSGAAATWVALDPVRYSLV